MWSTAQLQAQSAPVVAASPANQALAVGNAATFTAAATGTPAPTVQWEKSTDGGVTFSNVSGATSATLSIASVAQTDYGFYKAVFTNGSGSVTTSGAWLLGPVWVATMTPVSGATNSQGYGSASFVLSQDMTYATVRFSYSNLTTPEVMQHIHGPTDSNGSNPTTIIFDFSDPPPPSITPQPFPDGSYQWIFPSTGNPAAADDWHNLQAGLLYINIHTSQYPNGEIKGYFNLASGSQTFTPPAAPPTITINPPTKYDAARVFFQGGFGGTQTEVNNLSSTTASNKSTAINDWITGQFASALPISKLPAATYSYTPTSTQTFNLNNASWYTPYGTGNPNYAAATTATALYSASSVYRPVFLRTTQAQSPNAYADAQSADRITEAWWGAVLGGSDQLRQRVATAYSELFVVSVVCDTVAGDPYGLGTYYDMLADDAFSNFRQTLYDVTLHPIMGDYLNMRGNNVTVTAGVQSSPNENYAREVMQLFTVGLYMLQPDGTLMLDSNSQPIATYQQPQITSIANVFTGWNYPSTYNIPTLPQPTSGNPVTVNYGSQHMLPMPLTSGSHSKLSKTLLSYPGAMLWTGGTTSDSTTPVTIPSSPAMTSTLANQELDFTLDNIFYHPNVGPFVCKSLIQRLVTSNPSRGYVYRIAQVFNDNANAVAYGYTPATQHVRGDMKAVIFAILTDYEARSAAVFANTQYSTSSTPGQGASQTNGKQREPIIRLANVLRPLHAYSKTGKWKIGTSDSTLGQTILRSPTVFNFFSPTYAQTGAVQSSGNVSPEFDIIDETTIGNAANVFWTGFNSYDFTHGLPSGSGFVCDNYGGDVYLDYSLKGNGLANAYSGGLVFMLQQAAPLLTAAPLDTSSGGTASVIAGYLAGQSATVNVQVPQALHLFACSPAAAAQP
jgi:uncharacterized protein (DUF1800 family)